MNVFANGFTLEVLLALLRRRKWIGLSVFAILASMLGSLILFLPNVYRSQALVLIESQQIPQEYIRSTVTKVVERRLQEISQELLSRSQLEQLAEQFSLYRQSKKEGASSEAIAQAMRKDIGIKVINARGKGGEAVAFGISYRSPDPQKAMQVANQLASLYIDANMRLREGQAASTSEFLAKQVQDIQVKLEQQEETVTAYKRQHLGELPEQREANLGMIDALQKQMTLLSDNIARAQERRNTVMQMATLEAELAEVEMSNTATRNGTLDQSPSTQLSPQQQLRILQSQLAQYRVRFSEKHPDVIRLKQVIATLESQIEKVGSSLTNNETPETEEPFNDTTTHTARTAATKAAANRVELASIDSEILRMNGELRKISSDVAMYQQRIENTPRVEQELLSITRDYNTTRELYASLLKRLDEARLADKLEQNQKAEKFKILEPAFFPDNPEAPERERLFLVALFVSLGAALGSMLLREMLDTSFHDVDDLRSSVKVPVLISIPRIVTTTDLWRGRFRQGIGAVALTLSVVVIIGVMYRVVTGNENLTRTLLRSDSPNQMRE
jgi:polysaccharide chain length determinant protein (PEP-CTERM system associated)